MTKKISIAAICVLILAALISGCSQALSPSSPSVPAGTQAPSTSPVSPTAPDDSGSVVQAGLPIKVTQPVDGANLNTDAVIVQGQTAPGATVSVNEQVSTADKSGNFSVTLKLVDGPNFLDISAIDDSGNRGEITLMVNVDLSQASSSPGLPSLPSDTIPLKVVAPADGANLNTANITVKGQTAPEAVVSVNDQVDIADEQGDFSIVVSLENGINVISVVASDDSGNQAEVILMVNVTGS